MVWDLQQPTRDKSIAPIHKLDAKAFGPLNVVAINPRSALLATASTELVGSHSTNIDNRFSGCLTCSVAVACRAVVRVGLLCVEYNSLTMPNANHSTFIITLNSSKFPSTFAIQKFQATESHPQPVSS